MDKPAYRRIGTLSGSDSATHEIVPESINDTTKNVSSISINDGHLVKNVNRAITGNVRQITGAAGSRTRNVNLDDGGRLFDPRLRATAGDPDYYFYETVPEEVLHRYIDRSIAMESMCNQLWTATAIAEYEENMDMLLDMQPKFIMDMGGQSSGTTQGYADFKDMLGRLKNTVNRLKANDPDVICAAYMSESVSSWATAWNRAGIPDPPYIPYYVFYDLGITGMWRGLPINNDVGPVTITIPSNYIPGDRERMSDFYFVPEWMHKNKTVPDPTGGELGKAPSYNNDQPDITLVEAQLFYYYLATKYIDAGCEAIGFSDYWVVNKVDKNNGNAITWKIFSAIRAYAKKYASRKTILLFAHDHGEGGDINFYYDPNPAHPLAVSERQLIFDIVYWGLGFTRPAAPPCVTDVYQPQILTTNYGLIGRSPGGRSPQGWQCSHLPYFLHFDHGGGIDSPDDTEPGCDYATIDLSYVPPPDKAWLQQQGLHQPCKANADMCSYGWDNMSWFASQGYIHNPNINSHVRDYILKYLYYKIKCLDPYGHFMMAGREAIRKRKTDPPNGEVYRANMSRNSTFTPAVYKQQDTIKKIWSGLFSGIKDWSFYYFTKENVVNGMAGIWPNSALVFVGTDKMYFIASDGYIHGYIRVTSGYNGGTWLTVSPSYAANIPAGSQVKAKSDLVASPDGKRLLYIGMDGYIHGFDIVDVWRYQYFDFLKPEMTGEGYVAISSLIYPIGDRIYYIGVGPATGLGGAKRFVYGFVRNSSGAWITYSPCLAADYTGINGQRLTQQKEAAGALTYDHLSNRIYYRDVFGYLAYYKVNGIWSYFWEACPGNFNLYNEHLKIVGNLAIYKNRIYFVARYLDKGTLHIHYLEDNAGVWNTGSPSYSAALYNSQPISSQRQSNSSGQIAVSPDGNTIVYFADAALICYFKFLGGYRFSYHVAPQPDSTVDNNSLQFKNNGEFCYINTIYNTGVHCYKYEEAYCENDAIKLIEGGGPI